MISTSTFAQRDWMRYRYEIIGGIGPTFFLGELGGRNQVGTQSLLDLDFRSTRFGGHIGMRYFLMERLAIQTTFAANIISGYDELTNEFYRQDRNLHFRSPIYELSVRLEYKIRKEKAGHRYDLRGVRGLRASKFVAYAFVGLGGFYFNPKAKIEDTWVALQPIGTEGQNFMETRKPYSRISVSIPLGIQFKYLANRYWAFSFEIGPRILFTDYVDDVSTTYVNPDLVAEYDNTVPDNVARYASDPRYSAELDINGLHTNANGNYSFYNSQRGDPYDNDSYIFAMLTVHYKLKAKRNGWPTFKK